MSTFPFYIVDVFAEKKYAGNQLAVIQGAHALSDDEMQSITREMNYSETTFILSDDERNNGYDVRIFTPAEEVPFAGHPTLGTAFIIQQEIIKRKVEQVNLNLKIGQIPVTFKYDADKIDNLWMKQINPVFSRVFEPDQLCPVLNINEQSIDTQYPVQIVSTGLPCIIVPMKHLNDVKNVRINLDAYYQFIRDKAAKAILIFSPETYQSNNNLNVRLFADALGVLEDPATGSANGCLAGYLVKHRYFRKPEIDIRVEQGYEICRPSLLYLKASQKEQETIDVFVGGKVLKIARGTLY